MDNGIGVRLKWVGNMEGSAFLHALLVKENIQEMIPSVYMLYGPFINASTR